MKTTNFVLVSAIAVAALGLASADGREYANVSGDAFLVCYPDGDGPIGGSGGVCWAGGHILPDSLGQATVSLTDDLVSPVGGVYCQDLDANVLCGDEAAGEPWAEFCGAITITDGVDWVSAGDVTVFINGPILGSPVLSTCGTVSVGTHGFANHS
jgi:hypothetical protein